MVVAPHLDGLFITLARARFRFLSTVLDSRKEARAMGRMIAHAKFALDHLGDSRCGPDLPAEAERFGSSRQQCWHLIHWLTAPSVIPRATAIAFCFHPCSYNSHARRRRPSRQSFGRGVLVFIPPCIGS